MSGTSLDRVDFALCHCRGRRTIQLHRHWSARFPLGLHRRLDAAAGGRATSWEVGQLHHDLGRFFARAAQAGLRGERLSGVGLHGQTAFHQSRTRARATFQLGEPAYLAETLRVPIVSNFRAADLAAGGQGAPLATLFHRTAFARRGAYLAVHNLGGISNVTALDWSARGDAELRVQAFDTGPANALLDRATRAFSQGRLLYDRDGRWARRGRVIREWLQDWMQHPFIRRRPPKSTGREEFGDDFWKPTELAAQERSAPPEDVLASLTEFTAESIALNYDRFLRNRQGRLPECLVVAGGGAANRFLVERIQAALQRLDPQIQIRRTEDLGWPHQTIEASAFAWLAHYRLRAWPANLPETTGAIGPRLLGQVTSAYGSES